MWAGWEAWRQGGSLFSPPGRRHLFPYKVLSPLPQTASDEKQGGVVGGGAEASSWSCTLLTHSTAPKQPCLRAARSQAAPGLLEAIAYRWPLKIQTWLGNQDPWFPILAPVRGSCPRPSLCAQGVQSRACAAFRPTSAPTMLPKLSVKLLPRCPGRGPTCP